MKGSRFANAIILLAAVGCLAIAVFALTRFGERAQDYWPVLIFVALPLVLAAGFFIFLWFSPQVRIKLVLTLVGVGFGMIVAEAYLWLLDPPRTHLDYRLRAAKAWGYPPDDRSVIDVIRDLEKDGRAVYPYFVSW